jgi:hypothetical protein
MTEVEQLQCVLVLVHKHVVDLSDEHTAAACNVCVGDAADKATTCRNCWCAMRALIDKYKVTAACGPIWVPSLPDRARYVMDNVCTDSKEPSCSKATSALG